MVTMTRIAPAFLLFFILGGCARHAPPATAPAGGRGALTVQDVKERPVFGVLGIPLGTVAEVGAVMTTGSSKDDADRYRLRVTQVGGRELAAPVELDFSLGPGADVALPRDRKSEPGYLGRKVRLIVYETGEFSGIPTLGLEGYANWQDRAFHFATSLVVLAEAQSAGAR